MNFNNFEMPFNERLSEEKKVILADALADDAIFKPIDQLTLFPLGTVRVSDRFSSDIFFFTNADGENPFGLENPILLNNLDPTLFPPQKDFDGHKRHPISWLGIWSPDEKVATKLRSAMLGALALTPLSRHRHMFSGREVIEGQCTIQNNGVSYSFKGAHTPPSMYDIILTKADHVWMQKLSEKIASPSKTSRRELRALEYFYRAWSLDKTERFPILCMALDSIFGDANNATQAVIEGIRQLLGEHISDPQLRLLMGLRASVIHGGAPDVYDSKKYAKYYRDFGSDPIHDLELVVAECLKEKIFGKTLMEHSDPNADIIKQGQESGRFPKRMETVSILSSNNNDQLS